MNAVYNSRCMPSLSLGTNGCLLPSFGHDTRTQVTISKQELICCTVRKYAPPRFSIIALVRLPIPISLETSHESSTNIILHTYTATQPRCISCPDHPFDNTCTASFFRTVDGVHTWCDSCFTKANVDFAGAGEKSVLSLKRTTRRLAARVYCNGWNAWVHHARAK